MYRTLQNAHIQGFCVALAIFVSVAITAGAVMGPGDKGLVQLVAEASPPGAVVAFAGEKPPQGWLLCDGSPKKRTDYPALFQAIGTAHGSPDDSHFNLPDLRGLFLRGVSGDSPSDPDRETRTAMKTGGNAGNRVGSVQQDQLKAHSHKVDPPQTTTSANGAHSHQFKRPLLIADIDRGASNEKSNWSIDNVEDASTTDSANHTHTIDTPQFDSASSGGAENRPKNVYVHYIIKN